MKIIKQVISPTVGYFPAPVILLTCGTMEKSNIITLAWSGVLCSKPPLISASIRPQRYSYGLVTDSKEFVINIPTVEQLEVVEFCGTKSGREIDKWRECSLTPKKPEQISVPLISECPINIECKVVRTVDAGTHTIFMGEVLCVHKPVDSKSAFEKSPLSYSLGKYGQIISL